jgi:hypothetical protein
MTSPLFSVRTKRAINEEQNYETCSYLGKGKEITLSIPKRDNRRALFQDMIAKIGQMDDQVFNRLVSNVITRLNQDDEFNDIDNQRIIFLLRLLRNNPDKIENMIIGKNDYFKALYTSECTLNGKWFPGCLVVEIIRLILGLVIIIYVVLTMIYDCGWGPETSYYSNCMEC